MLDDFVFVCSAAAACERKRIQSGVPSFRPSTGRHARGRWRVVVSAGIVGASLAAVAPVGEATAGGSSASEKSDVNTSLSQPLVAASAASSSSAGTMVSLLP